TAIISYCLIFLVIKPLFLQPYSIFSDSMSPGLRPGDRVLVSKSAYWFVGPRRGDIVAIHAPVEAIQLDQELKDQELVKRVIGLGGDVVESRGGSITVNGKPIPNEYGKLITPYNFAPLEIPRGELFVLGDNRASSFDSHQWGPIEKRLLVGRVTGIVWPPAHIGSVR
ncbi:MAG: signal peptidase I, partial [Chthonomonadales bacterium]